MMSYILIALLVLYWAFGTWFMAFVIIKDVDGEVTAADLLGCMAIGWVLGGMAGIGYWLRSIKLTRK
jgi:hypothetical protein